MRPFPRGNMRGHATRACSPNRPRLGCVQGRGPVRAVERARAGGPLSMGAGWAGHRGDCVHVKQIPRRTSIEGAGRAGGGDGACTAEPHRPAQIPGLPRPGSCGAASLLEFRVGPGSRGAPVSYLESRTDPGEPPEIYVAKSRSRDIDFPKIAKRWREVVISRHRFTCTANGPVEPHCIDPLGVGYTCTQAHTAPSPPRDGPTIPGRPHGTRDI